jgi:hypothetical protein
MMSEYWTHDRLLSELQSAVAETVPPKVIAAAKGAYAWRTIDADLGALVADSLDGQESVVTVRSASSDGRNIVFQSVNTTVELEIGPTTLFGQVDPPRPGRMIAVSQDGVMVETEVNDLGWMTMALPSGVLRFRFEAMGERPLVTDWILV